MEIFVKLPDGRKVAINKNDLTRDDTIHRLKEVIAFHWGVPSTVLCRNGERLDNELKIYDYGIKNGDTLEVDPVFRVIIKSKYRGNPANVECLIFDVKATDTVRSLKEKIRMRKNIPPKTYILLNGPLHLDDEDKTLESYFIRNETVISRVPLLDLSLQVFVKMHDGKTKTYEVLSGDTIQKLKDMIHEKALIPFDMMLLRFCGYQLEDGKTFADYDIWNERTLYLTLRFRFKGPCPGCVASCARQDEENKVSHLYD